MKRGLPFLALPRSFAQSLRDDQRFSDLQIEVGILRKELATRRAYRVAKPLSAPKRCIVSAYSPPRLGLPHAFEQRVDAHADDDHVLRGDAVHGSSSRSRAAAPRSSGVSS